MPGPDDSEGHPEFATVQPSPVPLPERVIDALSGLLLPLRPKPFEVFGEYCKPKSNPTIEGER